VMCVSDVIWRFLPKAFLAQAFAAFRLHTSQHLPARVMVKSAATRQKDCNRRRAVSLYLAHHRAKFEKALRRRFLRHPNAKRKELERLAREFFKGESSSVQQEFLDNARDAFPDVPVEATTALAPIADEMMPKTPVRASVGGEEMPESPVRAVVGDEKMPETLAPASVWSVGVQSLLDKDPTESLTVGQHKSVIKNDISSHAKVLQKLYGDAGALEVMASAFRITEQVDVHIFVALMELKVAVVIGMAATYTQTVGASHTTELCGIIAGRGAEQAARTLEVKVISVWAKRL